MATLKLITPTILFYIVATIVVIFGNKFSPGGPCVPGLGDLSFILLIPVCIALMAKNIFLTMKKDRAYMLRTAFHFSALVALFIIARHL